MAKKKLKKKPKAARKPAAKAKRKSVKKAKRAKKSKPGRKTLSPDQKSVLTNLKVPESTLKALNAKAKKHAKGNFSAWMRYAGSHYTPPKNVVIE